MMQEKEFFQESFREADNWILIINFVQVDFQVLIKNNKNKPLYGRYVFPISAVSLMSDVAPLTFSIWSFHCEVSFNLHSSVKLKFDYL